MTELMKLYLDIKAKNPGISNDLARQQASIYFFRKNLPFPLTADDKVFLSNLSLSSGINGELTYVAPIPNIPEPEDPSTNNYCVDDYIDEYFE